MSPSWRDRLRIALTHSGAAMERCPAGWRPGWQSMPEAGMAAAAAPVPHELALAALAEALQGVARPRRGGMAEVVLSQSLVRSFLVPWSAEVTGQSEWAALTEACFESSFGESISGWQVAAPAGPYGHARPAMAVPRALSQGMAELLAARGFRLAHARPFFSVAFNRHLLRALADDCLGAVIDGQSVSVAAFGGGCWRSLRTLHPGPEGWAGLERLLATEAALQGLATAAPILVCAADNAAAAALAGSRRCRLPVRAPASGSEASALLWLGWGR